MLHEFKMLHVQVLAHHVLGGELSHPMLTHWRSYCYREKSFCPDRPIFPEICNTAGHQKYPSSAQRASVPVLGDASGRHELPSSRAEMV